MLRRSEAHSRTHHRNDADDQQGASDARSPVSTDRNILVSQEGRASMTKQHGWVISTCNTSRVCHVVSLYVGWLTTKREAVVTTDLTKVCLSAEVLPSAAI